MYVVSFFTDKMSSRDRSPVNQQGRSRRVSDSYDEQRNPEVNESRPLLVSRKSSKQVTVCTLCGLCRGIRTVPKSSLLSLDRRAEVHTFLTSFLY